MTASLVGGYNLIRAGNAVNSVSRSLRDGSSPRWKDRNGLTALPLSATHRSQRVALQLGRSSVLVPKTKRTALPVFFNDDGARWVNWWGRYHATRKEERSIVFMLLHISSILYRLSTLYLQTLSICFGRVYKSSRQSRQVLSNLILNAV